MRATRITDNNYYPADFVRFKVTSEDTNGNPLETVFYSDTEATRPVFRWVQVYNVFSVCTDWKIVKY